MNNDDELLVKINVTVVDWPDEGVLLSPRRRGLPLDVVPLALVERHAGGQALVARTRSR